MSKELISAVKELAEVIECKDVEVNLLPDTYNLFASILEETSRIANALERIANKLEG